MLCHILEVAIWTIRRRDNKQRHLLLAEKTHFQGIVPKRRFLRYQKRYFLYLINAIGYLKHVSLREGLIFLNLFLGSSSYGYFH